jgi:hypothetical protein
MKESRLDREAHAAALRKQRSQEAEGLPRCWCEEVGKLILAIEAGLSFGAPGAPVEVDGDDWDELVRLAKAVTP